MTKSEIEKLIEYIDDKVEKRVVDLVVTRPVVCSVNDLYDLLRRYPTDEEKTCDSTESRPMVMLFLDGNLTPLNFVKSIIDSGLLTVDEISEMIAYLEVYTHYHSDGGILK